MNSKRLRKLIYYAWLLGGLFAISGKAPQSGQEQPTPEQLAQRQLDAYNNRDIEAFLEPYADDVEVYNFPDELVYKGKAPMRATYAAMFARFTELHCVVTQRIVQGTTVIDKERITGLDRASVLEATAIYQVKDGKIQTVHFIR